MSEQQAEQNPQNEETSSALVVTSIAGSSHPILLRLAASALRKNIPFIVIGDTKSPEAGLSIPGIDFYSHSDARLEELNFARWCPKSTYSRKNLGYLLAIRLGVEWIVETDDDNDPDESFWITPDEIVSGRISVQGGWVNAYASFTDKFIYPRGFPLDEARQKTLFAGNASALSPIQQRLVNGDPDVDAVYRMLFELPMEFEPRPPLILERGGWCPFNSQNTVFFRRAFPLLYLPSFCSFRMTDIWRSFVAQRILQENGYALSFHAPNAVQHRNEHDLMSDFAQEIPGYLENKKIVSKLSSLALPSGDEKIPAAVYTCYEAMVSEGWLPEKELSLLLSWLENLEAVRSARSYKMQT